MWSGPVFSAHIKCARWDELARVVWALCGPGLNRPGRGPHCHPYEKCISDYAV